MVLCYNNLMCMLKNRALRYFYYPYKEMGDTI